MTAWLRVDAAIPFGPPVLAALARVSGELQLDSVPHGHGVSRPTHNGTIDTEALMQSTQDTGAPAPQPSPRTFRLHRSDDRDLQFEGHLIGHAERNAGFPDRPVKVSIYATQSGKYVTHIERGALVMGGSREAEGL